MPISLAMAVLAVFGWAKMDVMKLSVNIATVLLVCRTAGCVVRRSELEGILTVGYSHFRCGFLVFDFRQSDLESIEAPAQLRGYGI